VREARRREADADHLDVGDDRRALPEHGGEPGAHGVRVEGGQAVELEVGVGVDHPPHQRPLLGRVAVVRSGLGVDDRERVVLDGAARGGQLFGYGIGGHVGSALGVLAVRVIVRMLVGVMAWVISVMLSCMGVAAAARCGMAVIVQVLFFGCFAVFAAVAFEQRTAGEFIFVGAAVENRKNSRFETEVRAERKGNLRILLLQRSICPLMRSISTPVKR
jgi:hypothetical protein